MARFLVIAEVGFRCERWIEHLQHAGHQTTIANGVEDGIEAARTGSFDVIAFNHTWADEASARVFRALRDTNTARQALLSTSDDSFSYAAARWANAVAGLLRASRDVRTLEEWAVEIGVSHGTLRNWCRAAHLSAKRSLILGRLLRAVHVAHGRPWHPERLLNVTDPRTLAKLLALGGLPSSTAIIRLDDLLTHQRLIQDESAIHALQRALATFL